MPKLSEKDLDRLFELKILKSDQFKRWFLGRTKKFGDRATTIVLTRSNWPYELKAMGKEVETDILLVFKDIVTDEKFGLHIENKMVNGKFTLKQAKAYRERAQNWRNREEYGRYNDFEIILIPPNSFYQRHMDTARDFTFVAHEDIAQYIPAFAANALRQDHIF